MIPLPGRYLSFRAALRLLRALLRFRALARAPVRAGAITCGSVRVGGGPLHLSASVCYIHGLHACAPACMRECFCTRTSAHGTKWHGVTQPTLINAVHPHLDLNLSLHWHAHDARAHDARACAHASTAPALLSIGGQARKARIEKFEPDEGFQAHHPPFRTGRRSEASTTRPRRRSPGRPGGVGRTGAARA